MNAMVKVEAVRFFAESSRDGFVRVEYLSGPRMGSKYDVREDAITWSGGVAVIGGEAWRIGSIPKNMAHERGCGPFAE